ncbi:MAG: carbamoyl-phosphate synthase domain-containing protein, partial [Cyanobacteria bacterium P01_D01_bin.2]
MSIFSTSSQPALLVLADGSVFQGRSFGATGTVIGEIVFNTGMTGYQEVLTDPSYRGQIVTFTYPELGNTGVNSEDEESIAPQVMGAIAKN